MATTIEALLIGPRATDCLGSEVDQAKEGQVKVCVAAAYYIDYIVAKKGARGSYASELTNKPVVGFSPCSSQDPWLSCVSVAP